MLAMAALAGCSQTGPGRLSFAPLPPRAAMVADGEVRIRGPKGFCIVPDAIRQSPGGDFLLLASCAAISGSPRHPHPELPALITVTVSGTPLTDELSSAALHAFFASKAGRAALSRSGRAEDVRILGMEDRDGMFIIHLRDDGNSSLPGTKGEYWRAMFDLRQRIVTVSVIPPDNTAPGKQAERKLLLSLVETLRAANPQGRGGATARAGTGGRPPKLPRPRPRLRAG